MRLLVFVMLSAPLLVVHGCQTASNGTPSGLAAHSGSALPAQDGGSGSRYHGYVKLPHRSTRLPATLDLVRNGTAEPAAYLGFFKMSAGGFDSHEYVTLYYKDVRIGDANAGLTFGGGPEGVRLEGVSLSDGATVIKGNVITDKEQVTAPFELQLDLGGDSEPTAFAGMPIAAHMTGHYVAECADHREILQLEASRWRGRRESDSTLFGGYRVFGRKGRFDDVICGDHDKACVAETYPDVAVDFLGRTLQLKGEPNAVACRVNGAKVSCDGPCALVKDTSTPHTVLDVVREEERHERTFKLPAEDATTHPKGRGGQYYGYLHHEGRDSYQLVALNVKAAPEVDIESGAVKASGEHVAAVATLYFGEGDSSEFIAYRFNEATVGGSSSSSVTFDGAGEALFVVEDWSASIIRGTWYGKTFGRIGTVELTRDLVPEIPPKLTTVQGLTGLYRGEGWDFEMAASANLSEEDSAFYPLKLFGWARERLDSSRRRSIEDGAYDFYTGALALRLDDGRTVLGQVGNSGIELYWAPVPRLGSPLTTAEYRTFKRIGDPSGPQAKLQRRP